MTISVYRPQTQVPRASVVNPLFQFGSRLWWHTKALTTVLGLMGLTIFSLLTLVLCEALDQLFQRIQSGTSSFLNS